MFPAMQSNTGKPPTAPATPASDAAARPASAPAGTKRPPATPVPVAPPVAAKTPARTSTAAPAQSAPPKRVPPKTTATGGGGIAPKGTPLSAVPRPEAAKPAPAAKPEPKSVPPKVPPQKSSVRTTGVAGGGASVAGAKKAAAQKTKPVAAKVFFGLAHYVRDPKSAEWHLRPRWKLVGSILAGVFLLIYLAMAGFMYYLNKYVYGFEKTTFANMLVFVIPNKIPRTDIVILPEFLNKHVMAARDRQRDMISHTLSENPRNIAQLIWAAAASPRNLDAQFQAAYYMASPDWLDRFQDAFTLLDSTLPTIMDLTEPGEIRRNLMRYAQFCAQYDQDMRIIAAAEKYLDDPRMPADARNAFSTAYAEALFLRGDFTRASKALEKYKLLGNLSGFLLNARIIWENGEQERALRLLRNYIAETNDGKDKLLYAYAKCCWERNDKTKAAEALQTIIALQPDEFRPRIYLLGLLQETKDTKTRAAVIENFLTHFSANEPAMLSLGAYAADHGDVELQKRISAFAFENRFTRLANFRLLDIETLLSAGRNKEVLAEIAALVEKKPYWLREKKIQEQFEALRMLAYFGTDDVGGADLGIVVFNKIAKSNLSLPMMIAVSRRLLSLNRPQEATRLLRDAYIQNPYNQGILLELVKLDLANENAPDLDEHLRYLIDARRPPRYVIRQAYERIGGDYYLFSTNRDKLIADLDEMLTRRVLPKSELEKGWPDDLGIEREIFTPALDRKPAPPPAPASAPASAPAPAK